MAPSTPPRQAVYFTPDPAHPLWDAGCRWLGRDPRAGQSPTPPPDDVRAAPWRYGWHATLKAPFVLREGAAVDDWRAALADWAAAREPFDMPPLRVAMLGDFVALRPREPLPTHHPLRRLADDGVRALDCWRRPTGDDERRRRGADALAPDARERLERWGYPHVFEHWRFHMTLTGPLPPAARAGWLARAEAHFAGALREPLRCDALSLFDEPEAAAPFVLRERVPLAG